MLDTLLFTLIAAGAVAAGAVVTREPEAAPAAPEAAPEAEPAPLELPPPCDDPFLDSLTGDWAGTYTLMGNHFDVTAEVEWAFNHQFVRTLNHSRGAVGLLESQEVWQPTEEEGVYRLWWFDPFGNAGVAEARVTDDGFVIAGDDPGMGPFRNSVIRNGRDELIFRLDTGPDDEGNYQKAGEGVYRRVDR